MVCKSFFIWKEKKMELRPKISVVVPIHDMLNGDKFLWRLVNSLMIQTFKDWELIITKDGRMAENTNSGIKKARGEIIKILYLDDYFSDSQALDVMIGTLGNRDWLVCGTHNNPFPQYTIDIETGNNKLGSPSALMFRNCFENNLLFDEKMSWLLDADLYKRMYEKYREPVILTGNWITLGIGNHQMTYILTDEQKQMEHNYLNKKYGK